MIPQMLGIIQKWKVGRGTAPSKTPPPPLLGKERGIKGVRSLLKNQRGFTLIEVLIAVAIGGAIAGAGSMATRQVITETVRNNNHEIAVRQVQNAGHWVTRDTQMAQTVLTGDESDGILTLIWEAWDVDPDDGIPPDEYQVEYKLVPVDVNGVIVTKLKREHYTNRAADPDPDATSYVAKYIDSGQTSCDFEHPPMLTFTVTATVGGDSLQEGSETRIYEIVHRAVADGS